MGTQPNHTHALAGEAPVLTLQDIRVIHDRKVSEAQLAQASPEVRHEREVCRLSEMYFDKTKAEYKGREEMWKTE